jgi:hypothetical protein
MSETFVNYHVQTDDFELVCSVLPQLITGEAYVSPAKNSWITIYEQMTEFELGYDKINAFARNLSDRVHSTVIVFIVIDEIQFLYYVYESNQLIDSFDSLDESINDSRLEEHANLLLGYCLPDITSTSILNILSPCQHENSEYLGSDFPYLLAPILNIDPDRVILGFSRFTSDNLSDYGSIGEEEDSFYHYVCS